MTRKRIVIVSTTFNDHHTINDFAGIQISFYNNAINDFPDFLILFSTRNKDMAIFVVVATHPLSHLPRAATHTTCRRTIRSGGVRVMYYMTRTPPTGSRPPYRSSRGLGMGCIVVSSPLEITVVASAIRERSSSALSSTNVD